MIDMKKTALTDHEIKINLEGAYRGRRYTEYKDPGCYFIHDDGRPMSFDDLMQFIAVKWKYAFFMPRAGAAIAAVMSLMSKVTPGMDPIDENEDFTDDPYEEPDEATNDMFNSITVARLPEA
jgi:hypothetical protein